MNKYNNQTLSFNDILFKSKLEVNCYKKLLEAGFIPEYEVQKFVIFNGFRMSDKINYFTQIKTNNKGQVLTFFKDDRRKIRDITYLPDFYFVYKGYEIYFDTKGKANDVYPIKKKLFLNMLNNISEKTNKSYLFFEPHNIKQIKESIKIILELK